MRILMAMHSLAMGGAEKFFTNLASALYERHDVTCYIPLLACGDPAMIRRLGDVPRVSIRAFSPFAYKVFYKLTLMLQKHRPSFDPEAAWHDANLRAMHRRHRFQIVNAQLMEGARQTCRAFQHIPLPITESDHGDFAMVNPRQPGRNAVIFQRLDALICPSEANVVKARAYPWRTDCRLPVIRYGYRASPTAQSPRELNARSFTFGMVARGIEAKGWLEALQAARLLRAKVQRPVRLVFVGAGAFLESLKNQMSAEDLAWVHFAGQQEDPESWIRGFDVGLLPSFMPEESLPNTIIEYLACGKPVIATPIGGVPEMIGSAGRLVPFNAQGRPDVPSLAAAMTELMENAATREACTTATADAFVAYSMPGCVRAYEDCFSELMKARCP